MSTYETEALSTLSNTFHGTKVPYGELFLRIRNVIDACHALDKVKKSLFYGKPYEMEALQARGWGEIFTKGIINQLHGAIGLATEAGEVLELIALAVFDDGDIDEHHLEEELGDVFWYMAVLASTTSKTFTELQAQNLAKLKARYPDKFTEERALNRDLENEKRVLAGA